MNHSMKHRILSTSKVHFLKYGYSKTSLRNISSDVGISVSNIYNHYKNKEDIFAKIVEPTIGVIEYYYNYILKKDKFNDINSWGFEAHLISSDYLADFLVNHRENLFLIINRSVGSSYENYKDLIINKYINISKKWVKNAKNHHKDININISDYCINCTSLFWINIICDIINQNFNKKEILKIFKEMMIFVFYGYEGLMEFDFDKIMPKPLKHNK